MLGFLVISQNMLAFQIGYLHFCKCFASLACIQVLDLLLHSKESKESDDTLVDSRSSKRRLDVSAGSGVSNRPMTMRRQGPLVQRASERRRSC